MIHRDGIGSGVSIVSIPVGFSRSLQRWLQWAFFPPGISFNPCRVFTLAATSTTPRASWRAYRSFQSLSGFHARCNIFIIMHVRLHRHVSIPVGFSRSLQHLNADLLDGINGVSIPVGFSRSLQQKVLANRAKAIAEVSIPVGFSRSLQLPTTSPGGNIFQSFNPCRVFTLAATSAIALKAATAADQFQSLSGFHARCNALHAQHDVTLSAVSIPVGFSRSLQQFLMNRF